MKKYGLVKIFILSLGMTLSLSAEVNAIVDDAAQPKGAQPKPPEYVAGELLVKFRSGIDPAQPSLQFQQLEQTYQVIQKVAVFKQLRDLQEVKQRFPVRSRRAPKNFTFPDLSRWQKITYRATIDPVTLAEHFKTLPEVERAEPNYKVRVMVIPNDTYADPNPNDEVWSSGSWGQAYEDLWGLKKIRADLAWNLDIGSQSITVAVLDTGLDKTHEDIQGNVWTNPGEIPNNGIDDDNNGYIDDTWGWDFATCEVIDPFYGCTVPREPDNDPTDVNGHGTLLSGVVGAVGNNGTGMVGVNWQIKIMPLKVFSDGGTSGLENDFANAIQYAVENGADITNNSWGGDPGENIPQLLKDAFDYADGLGVIHAAAAGNENIDIGDEDNCNLFPACLDTVMAASASDVNDQKASFSNWGHKIEVAAPGVDILSLRAEGSNPAYPVGNHYARTYGTSISSPFVAGLAALVFSRQPTLSNKLARVVIQASADDIDTPGFDIHAGYGRINAYQALQKADEAMTKPELLIRSVMRNKSVVAPGSPLHVTIVAENVGKVAANYAAVDLFDGDPDTGGTKLDGWTVNLNAESFYTFEPNVTLSALGSHVLYAVADRQNTVTELFELNNKKKKSVEVAISQNGDNFPTAPTGLTATPGNQQISLDWPDNPEPDIQKYAIYRHAIGGGFWFLSYSTLSSYTDTGLTNSAIYYYRVTAIDNGNGESAYSNEASATPQSPPPGGGGGSDKSLKVLKHMQ